MKITKQDLIELGHDPELIDDWFIIRKSKRAPDLTGRAWQTIKNQATQCGLNEFQTVQVMVDNEWRGFKADWYTKINPVMNVQTQKQAVRHSLRDIGNTDW